MQSKSCNTHWARIYVAGYSLDESHTYSESPYTSILSICQDYVDRIGLCVNVAETDYIYTGGREPGVTIELINYPKYPSNEDLVDEHAYNLALEIVEKIDDINSFSIMTPEKTIWVDIREDPYNNLSSVSDFL